jgi:Protein of unknown function (DUF1236)
MTSRFMMSVAAAALIAGAGFANAQGTGTGSSGSTVQNAPSPGGTSAAPAGRDASEPSDMKAKQSDQKTPGGAKNQSAQDNMKAGTKGEKSAQDKSAPDTKSAPDKSAQDNVKGDKSKSMSSETNERGRGPKDMKAEGRDGNMKAEGRDGNMNAETKGAAENRSQTIGQAGAGARLSTEQRTKISTVIRDQHVQPITNANFAITIGARVPREVSFRPLPAEVVTVYPEWRGYEFFLIRDQIVVVNPRTMEIVAVLDA